ncbi:MAG: hypothetical protein ACYCW6_21850 [Candidatus Xenobia bacterium]
MDINWQDPNELLGQEIPEEFYQQEVRRYYTEQALNSPTRRAKDGFWPSPSDRHHEYVIGGTSMKFVRNENGTWTYYGSDWPKRPAPPRVEPAPAPKPTTSPQTT